MICTLNIPGYDITEVIYQGANTIICRGITQPEQQNVILKILAAEYPTLEQIARLKHEYFVTENLELEGIVKVLGLKNYQNRSFLVAEDFGGISLKQFISLKQQNFDFLSIAIQLAKALLTLHTHHIIHKDIKPSNIIINPQSGQVKITDFSIASRLDQETPQLINPEQLEGTLAYMSPEQTGRMNRLLDYRTDFYSLGVTFYEILTNQLPFNSSDPLELVYCHLAKPTPIQELTQVPTSIAAIVTKLMAKNAEDRYQSAAGLLADLEFCLTELQNQQVYQFIPGQKDRAAQLLIPQKLYGREEEVATLLAAFDRASQGQSEMILVSGYSGIGKSSLVAEVHKPIVRQKGWFISGKFDQLGRNIPYASLIQAFQVLMRQLLTESADKLESWQMKLLAALGSNGQVIVDVIPEVELIIGKQPEVTQLGATETQIRFNRVFQEFIFVFCQPEHPLVLFLDDLQWADFASLKFLQVLMTSNSEYLLFIGAYRDNEVSTDHPLTETLEEIEKFGTLINNIVLRPLEQTQVQEIIADTLNNPQLEINPLAQLLFNKTQGNPFFLTQLLKTLHQEKLLKFNFSSGKWEWDIQNILVTGIADNSVVDLVAGNIQKLPANTQNILKLAACIGSRFSLDVLTTVNEQSLSSTAEALQPALQQGFVLPLNKDYKVPLLFADEELDSLGVDNIKVGYRFLHDRVQQAAYSLIPEYKKQETHLKIGRLLLQKTICEEVESNIFDIVNQLNIGISQLIEQSEKDELAKLNLIAGRKAKTAAAYHGAFKYLITGLELLSVCSWSEQYDLTLALYEEAAETAYLTGEFAQTEKYVDTVLQQTKTILDQVKVYHVKIQAKIAQTKLIESIQLGLELLQLLGIKLSKSPTPLDIQQALEETITSLCETKIPDLINLPLMTDASQLAAMETLSILCFPTIAAAPQLFPLTVFKQVNLSIKHGNAPCSTFAYATYGFILQGIVQDVEASYQFGKLALSLVEKLNALQLKARTFFMTAVSTKHGKEHIRETLPLFQEAYKSGLENGDLEYLGHSAVNLLLYSYFTSLELAPLKRKILSINHTLVRLKQEATLYHVATLQQVILNLTEKVEQPWCLTGEAYNEEKILPLQIAANDRIGLHFVYANKLILCYLFGQYSEAVVNAEQVQMYLDGVRGTLYIPIYYFYDCLARLAIYLSVERNQQQQILAHVEQYQDTMQMWAEYAPMNFEHKYDLVAAEKYRVLGENYQAMEYYDQAIAKAAKNDYIQEEALANELAAKFYLNWNKSKIAKTYMTEAYYCYIKWGATTKAQDLERRYPELIIRSDTTNFHNIVVTSTTHSTGSTSSSSQILDLSTIIKASEAISSKVFLDNLPRQILHIILENAGAKHGCLILNKNNQLFVEAIDNDSNAIVVPESILVQHSSHVPISLINYVARTQQTIVIKDGTTDFLTKNDHYIIQHQCKSILCIPLINQGKFEGIIYLENNLTSNAFTLRRLELIKILASQATIAINNANLYAKEQEKSQQLQATVQQLEQALTKLQQTQTQLVHTEKISSLGQLVAGIAHEVNNPVSFINGSLAHANQYVQDLLHILKLYRSQFPQPGAEIEEVIETIDLEYILADLPKIISSMKLGTTRIKDIMQSLRNFSRNDGDDMRRANIHEGIDSTLLILGHRLKNNPSRPEIQVTKEYGNLPLVKCYPGALNQVFMNILANAIDALEEFNQGKTYQEIEENPNKIIISTTTEDNWAIIRIKDNGSGISKEKREKLFQAFFTTKPEGKGTGLGLSISYQILTEKHGGILECVSAIGEGSEFIIKLPCDR